MATLTFVYRDSTAVVGPLALRPEPGAHDLCAQHAAGQSTPRGWELIRLPLDVEHPGPSAADLDALADAVREVGFTYDGQALEAEPVLSRRVGHLGVVADLPGPADRLERTREGRSR